MGGRRRRAASPTSPRTARSTALAADGHSVHVVAALDGPSWYRFRAGGFTSPAGRAAPTGSPSTLRLATASCQHWADRLLRRPPRHRRVGAGPRRLPRRLHLRGRRRARRRRSGQGPRRSRADRPRRLPGALRPVPDRPATCRRRGPPARGSPIWDDHEVENNYAALDAAGPRRRGDVRRPPCRRLPGLVGAHAGAPPGPGRRHGLPDHPIAGARRPGRPDPARRPPVPQRPGVRRRHAADGPAVPGGARPGADHARRRRRSRGWPTPSPPRRRRGRCSASRPCSPTCACRTGRSSTTTSGTATRRRGTGCSPRPPASTGSSCSPATSTSPASASSPASAPSS